MRRPTRLSLLRYGAAALSVAVALAVKLLVDPLIESESPFLLFFGAVMFSAWFGGLGPGLFATALAALISDYFFLMPVNSFFGHDLGQNVRLGLFVLEGVVISAFSAALHATRQRAEVNALKWQESEGRLQVTLSSIGDAVIATDLQGMVTFMNPVATALVGWREPEAVGKPISAVFKIVNAETRAAVSNPVEKVIRQGEIAGLAKQTVLIARDGREVPIDDSAAPIRDARGNVIGVVLIFRDITERRRLETERERSLTHEQAVRARAEQSQQRMTFLAEASEILASSLDYETTLTNVVHLAVPFMADFCCIDLLQLDGSFYRLPVAHADPSKAELAQRLQTHPPRPQSTHPSVKVIRTGQSELVPHITDEWLRAAARNPEHLAIIRQLGYQSALYVPLVTRGQILGTLTLVAAESGRRYDANDLSLAEEIARRAAATLDNARLHHETQQLNEELEQRVAQRTAQLQAANEQLRDLAAHLQTAREEERANVARELHDELGQILTAAKIDVFMLTRKVKADPEAATVARSETLEELQAITETLDETIKSVRRIITHLRPEILDDLGLRDAIEWQVQQFQARTGIECQFNANVEEIEWDRERSLAMFRILQESLTNVARHANATHVDISLKAELDHLMLEVRDNGRGISADELAKANHFGLLGMRERVTLLGGEININGMQGQGTVVAIRVPT